MKLKTLLFTLAIILLSVTLSFQGERLDKQQKLLNEADVKIEELRIIVNQRVLPAMILDKESISVR